MTHIAEGIGTPPDVRQALYLPYYLSILLRQCRWMSRHQIIT
jgi:hypothetical protein